MLVKGLAFTALLASTPIAIVATQDPRPVLAPVTPLQQPATGGASATDLALVRQELATARGELQQLRTQLEQALDVLDRTFEPQEHRNCSPSRSRAMMSHYQWLRTQGHGERAASALAKVVDRLGDDPNRLNGVAWDLMTDEDTAGKHDEVALAIAERMAARQDALQHNHLDTMALAHFLNGRFERAIALQQQAIDAGHGSGDYRRRLRIYEAARDALAKGQGVVPATPAATLIAGGDDD